MGITIFTSACDSAFPIFILSFLCTTSFLICLIFSYDAVRGLSAKSPLCMLCESISGKGRYTNGSSESVLMACQQMFSVLTSVNGYPGSTKGSQVPDSFHYE